MPDTLRTFIAVDASPAVRGQASHVIRQLAKITSAVRWVTPESMHVTLKFLGDVDSRDFPEICHVMSKVVADVPPIQLITGGVGAFPSPHHPRTIWIGFSQGAEQLVHLHRCLDDGLHELGFRREPRKFQPHLTIGRVNGSGSELTELCNSLQSGIASQSSEMLIDEVVLYSSELTPDGPIYDRIAGVEMSGEEKSKSD